MQRYFKTFLALFSFVSFFCVNVSMANTVKVKNTGDYVVLLHGIARTPAHMAKLEKAFDAAGYRVINLAYPSREKTISEIVSGMDADLAQARADSDRKINFIGYSMGGLVARAYIKEHRPANLGRVLLLGAPNHGSEVADFLRRNFIYRSFYGPAGQELATGRDNDALFGTPDYPVSVIAGTWTIDPVSSYLLLPRPNDGKVSVESTKVEGMMEHLVLPVSHTFMPQNKTVIAAALAYIQTGRFPSPAPKAKPAPPKYNS